MQTTMDTTIDTLAYTVDCTGDACAGDTILFSEAVYAGSFRRSEYLGLRWIAARIVKDSYGAARQQHTFTLDVIGSDGVDRLTVGARTTRKGRNVYKNRTVRLPWSDESTRKATIAEKHARGDAARSDRDARRMGEYA